MLRFWHQIANQQLHQGTQWNQSLWIVFKTINQGNRFFSNSSLDSIAKNVCRRFSFQTSIWKTVSHGGPRFPLLLGAQWKLKTISSIFLYLLYLTRYFTRLCSRSKVTKNDHNFYGYFISFKITQQKINNIFEITVETFQLSIQFESQN